jgi:predicted ester cyclase
MSKERELLESCLDEMQYHSVDCPELVFKIKELLAEPEPLTPRQGLEEFKKGYAQAEQDLKREPLSEEILYPIAEERIVDEGIAGFYDGFRFAEKHHGIGADNE